MGEKNLRKNDAGFQYVIDKKGIDAYNAHNVTFLNKIKNVKTDIECTQIIYQWLKFFRSGHIAISRNENQSNSQTQNVQQNVNPTNWETVKIDSKKFEKYLNSKKEADIEGIWETSPYVIVVKKFDNEYKRFYY